MSLNPDPMSNTVSKRLPIPCVGYHLPGSDVYACGGVAGVESVHGLGLGGKNDVPDCELFLDCGGEGIGVGGLEEWGEEGAADV